MTAMMDECPNTGLPIYRRGNGDEHRLGLLPPRADEESLLMASSVPIVKSDRWKVVTHEECRARIREFVRLWHINQRSHGSCVGFSAGHGLMWDLWSSGFPIEGKLSGSYTYGWINGNRDSGASIIAALDSLKRHGTCLEKTVPWNVIYRSQMPSGADQEAARFKLETGSSVEGFEAFVSAGQIGKPMQFGVQVGRNFEAFDDEGVCGYSGPGSNHSVMAPPLLVRKRGGGFKVPLVNSWPDNWGPYGEGWCYVDSRHIEGGGGGFYHGTPTFDTKRHLPGQG